MSGRRSRNKGKRGEREVVRLARAAGLSAERTWSLAQSADEAERACDVRIAGQSFQVERRRNGFGELYEGLANVSGLFAFAATGASRSLCSGVMITSSCSSAANADSLVAP